MHKALSLAILPARVNGCGKVPVCAILHFLVIPNIVWALSASTNKIGATYAVCDKMSVYPPNRVAAAPPACHSGI